MVACSSYPPFVLSTFALVSSQKPQILTSLQPSTRSLPAWTCLGFYTLHDYIPPGAFPSVCLLHGLSNFLILLFS